MHQIEFVNTSLHAYKIQNDKLRKLTSLDFIYIIIKINKNV